MSDVTDADRARAEEIISNAIGFKAVADPVLYSRDKLLSQLNHGLAAHRIAAERAAVERVVKMLRERAYKLGAMAYSKPEIGVAAKAICDAIDLIQGTEREGAK